MVSGATLFFSCPLEYTSVAISMPEHKGNGEFSVYVSIYQSGIGAAHVVPKDLLPARGRCILTAVTRVSGVLLTGPRK